MVVSKRCKVCTVIHDDSIGISGDYFDKSLPDLIEKISGIKLDPRKAKGVLICKLCAIQLLHIDMVIEKLRSTLQRLTKPNPKTPSKVTDANSDEPKLKSKTTLVRRKSVFVDDSSINKKEAKENVGTNGKLAKPLDFYSDKDSSQSNKEDEPKATTFQKEESLKSASFNKNEEEKRENCEIESNITTTELEQAQDPEATSKMDDTKVNASEVSKIVELRTKTPRKVVRRKSVVSKDGLADSEGGPQQSEELKISSTKFKKITDDEHIPANSTQTKPAKRKQILKEEHGELESNNIIKINDGSESTPVKRKKNLSISSWEGNCIDVVEQDLLGSKNESTLKKIKIQNCVICGKGFGEKAALRQHIESSHMGEKLKQCSYCSTEFRSQQKFESHIFSEKCRNSKHACQYPKCNKRFKSVYKMELHMQEKHSSQQRSEDD